MAAERGLTTYTRALGPAPLIDTGQCRLCNQGSALPRVHHASASGSPAPVSTIAPARATLTASMSHSSSREKTARKAVKPKSKTVLPDAPELSPHAEPVASTSAVPLEPGKKKKKSKSRPAEEDEPSHAPTDRTNRSDTHVAPSDQSTEDTQRPRKKRKSKHAVAEEGTPPDDADHNSIEGSDAEAQPKKRKKRKKIVDTDETEGGGKKKSRKGKEVGETDEEPETTVVKKSKKEKKRKHRDTADEETVAGADDGPSSEAPKKKKRKRGKTGSPNPEEDESLSEQAQKGKYLVAIVLSTLTDATSRWSSIALRV